MKTKFKTGQKVWVTGYNDPDLKHHYAIGDRVIIDKLDEYDETLLCRRMPDDFLQWVSACDVQKRKSK